MVLRYAQASGVGDQHDQHDVTLIYEALGHHEFHQYVDDTTAGENGLMNVIEAFNVVLPITLNVASNTCHVRNIGTQFVSLNAQLKLNDQPIPLTGTIQLVVDQHGIGTIVFHIAGALTVVKHASALYAVHAVLVAYALEQYAVQAVNHVTEDVIGEANVASTKFNTPDHHITVEALPEGYTTNHVAVIHVPVYVAFHVVDVSVVQENVGTATAGSHIHAATATVMSTGVEYIAHILAYTEYVCDHREAHVIVNDVADGVHKTVAHSLTSYVAPTTHVQDISIDVQHEYVVVKPVTGLTVVHPHQHPVIVTDVLTWLEAHDKLMAATEYVIAPFVLAVKAYHVHDVLVSNAPLLYIL